MGDSMDFAPSGNVRNLLHSCENPNENIIESTEFEDIHHPSIVLKNLAKFKEERFACDVEIEVDGVIFSAHRYILAAAIPYFRSMFASDMLESRQKRISIKDLSSSSFQQLLDFAYTSKIIINGSNVQQLLYSASIMQMDAVCTACQRFLTQYLTTSNCLSIRHFAEQHNSTSLMASVDDFIVDHFSELRLLPEFFQIPFVHLLELVGNPDLKVTCEQEVFETVIRWVEEDVNGRKEYLADILLHVRLPQLPVPYFLDRVKKHPLIIGCVKCREIIADAMSEIMRIQLIPKSFSDIGDSSSSSVSNQNTGAFYQYSYSANEIAVANSSTSWPQNICANPWTYSRPRKSAAGVIFCVGGRGTSGDPFRSVEAYHWRKDRWFSVSDMNSRRRHVGVVSARGKLYAIGGHDGNHHLNSAECFDPSANMWHEVSPMNTCRRGIAAGTLEGAIYAVGGLDDNACFQTVERYDIECDKWSEVAPMNVQRGGVGVAAMGKYLFAVGGNDGTSSLNSCERYHPLLNKWKLIASMQNRRAGAGVTVLDGFLYSIGGFDDNAPLSSCERYNPHENTWTLLSPMLCPRGGVGVAAMGGRIYAVGGHDGMRYLNSVEAYDPLTDQWAPVSSITQCRAGAGVAWADCMVDLLHCSPSSSLGKDSGCAPCVSGVAHCV